MKKKWISILWVTLAIYVGGFLSSVALAHWVKQNTGIFRMSVQETLEQLSKVESKTLPQALDEETQWDRVVAVTGNIYEYHYTWLVLPESDLTWLGHVLHDHWVSHYQNAEDLKFLRSMGTKLRLVYHNTEGHALLTIEVEAPTEAEQ